MLSHKKIFIAYIINGATFELPNINNMTTIKPNTTISARSICDSECIFTAFVVSRKGNFVTLIVKGNKEPIRKKVMVNKFDGSEYVMALGNYSMAPAFK